MSYVTLRTRLRCLMFPISLLLLTACHLGEPNDDTGRTGAVVVATPMGDVEVMTLHPTTFHHDVVSNGRVAARRYVDLYFPTGETVAHIYVANGQAVRRGETLAELETFSLETKLRQAEISLRNAELELQNTLIGQGYGDVEREQVPAKVLELAELRSGYAQSRTLYDEARHNREQAVLKAPFDGVVANLTATELNRVPTSGPFCRVIDRSSFEVSFTIIESELLLLHAGDSVQVTPYADAELKCRGRVTEINPVVDTRGTVQVTARLIGQPRLFDGMNVRVNVELEAGRQLVVPKSAVVMRSGKPVVFTERQGRAQWNYVELGLENMESYCITSGLTEGDRVIVSGNANLAHEAEVKVVREL